MQILILGATGILGQPVTRCLIDKGHRVRVMTRDLEKAYRIFGNTVEIVAGSAVDRLVSHFSVTDWPEVKKTQGPEINLDDTFKQALREALECSSVDSSRYVLNGACMDVTEKVVHYVVGTDGRHLYAGNSFQFSLTESLIVPSRRFIAWPGFMNDGGWKLSMLPKAQGKNQETEEPAWFEITSEHWSYMAKAIDERGRMKVSKKASLSCIWLSSSDGVVGDSAGVSTGGCVVLLVDGSVGGGAVVAFLPPQPAIAISAISAKAKIMCLRIMGRVLLVNIGSRANVAATGRSRQCSQLFTFIKVTGATSQGRNPGPIYAAPR